MFPGESEAVTIPRKIAAAASSPTATVVVKRGSKRKVADVSPDPHVASSSTSLYVGKPPKPFSLVSSSSSSIFDRTASVPPSTIGAFDASNTASDFQLRRLQLQLNLSREALRLERELRDQERELYEAEIAALSRK